ncbi:MAG: hypothetical protein U0K81_05705, partial [Paludibacteraceae bacterium]|nr:hypothetical protein [Paludibacteraceae bacterium]
THHRYAFSPRGFERKQLIRILCEHKCALIFTLVADDLTNRCWVLTKTHSLRSFTKKRYASKTITNYHTPAINTDKFYIIESIRLHTSHKNTLTLTKKRYASKTARLLLNQDGQSPTGRGATGRGTVRGLKKKKKENNKQTTI